MHEFRLPRSRSRMDEQSVLLQRRSADCSRIELADEVRVDGGRMIDEIIIGECPRKCFGDFRGVLRIDE